MIELVIILGVGLFAMTFLWLRAIGMAKKIMYESYDCGYQSGYRSGFGSGASGLNPNRLVFGKGLVDIMPPCSMKHGFPMPMCDSCRHLEVCPRFD